MTPLIVTKIFTTIWDSRISCHKQITTDQGLQFEASLFNILASITGSPLARTTSWHPDEIGMVNRLGRQLKAPLLRHSDRHWAEVLVLALFSTSGTWKEKLQASSSSSTELVYGGLLRLRTTSPALMVVFLSCIFTSSSSNTDTIRLHVLRIWPPPRTSSYGMVCSTSPVRPYMQGPPPG